MRIKEHLIKWWEALSHQAWSPHLMGAACWRRGVETRIKAQRGDERYLLVPTGCSQLNDAIGPIPDDLNGPIGEPSSDQLHELFGPLWNRFVSASQGRVHLL